MATSTPNVLDPRSTDHSKSRNKEVHPVNDLMERLREYAKDNPGAVALWCLGIGFVLGWKLKPW